MMGKKHTMIVMEPWTTMDNEEDFEDFSEGSMREISEIFSLHFSEEDSVVEADDKELISVKISRSV